MNTREREESRTLEILEAIEQRSDVTQRGLAQRMNIALGLANSYLRRCVRKGLVKIHQAPANRYLYYLTPKGFAEKSRLTAQYLSISFTFYRRAADSCDKALLYCRDRGWERVLLCGISDLSEIASLRALEHGVDVVGVFDPDTNRQTLLNHTVRRSLDDGGRFDACLLTDLSDPNAMFDRLAARVREETIVVPDILGLRREQ